MKQVLIVCFLFISVTGDKEQNPPPADGDALSKLLNDPNLSDLLNDPDLWLILKKRLGNECFATRRRNNTIIKTKDSMTFGASFIIAPTVKSEAECEKECCSRKDCNTAVLKNKSGEGEKPACYLFDCKSPNICVFTTHQGFSVLDFKYGSSFDEHADDLDQLAVTVATSIYSSTTATSTTTTTTTTPSTINEKAAHTQSRIDVKSAELFSNCLRASDCQDHNADCMSGYCVCQQGYHAVELQCRKDCNQELEFECANKGSPLYAECIAVYDRCDGTAQCSDGSDEVSCFDPQHKDEPEHHPNGDKQTVHPFGPSDSVVTVSSTQEVPLSKLNSPTQSPDPIVSQAVTNTSPSVVIPHETAKTTEVVLPSPTHRSAQKPQTLEKDENNEVHSEKVVQYFWRMETNRGAVIALVLGIILTTMLLILAGCRLRHYRKRYRKNRHLNSNDADYLINGMYL